MKTRLRKIKTLLPGQRFSELGSTKVKGVTRIERCTSDRSHYHIHVTDGMLGCYYGETEVTVTTP